MSRQTIRKNLTLLMFVLFPLIYYYMSPYLVIMGASEGVVNGSLLVFAALFVSSLFLGRAFCGWVCPAGATQEMCRRYIDSAFKNGRRNWIKYIIWAPWIAVIALTFIQAGPITAVDPFYQTYYGLSITGIESTIMFLAIAGSISGIALIAGRRASCHTICWMAPFMIIGRKVSNLVNLPALKLVSDSDLCINCKACTRSCSMSLDVNQMVKNSEMENTECVLCGRCVDDCPKGAIRFTFGRKQS